LSPFFIKLAIALIGGLVFEALRRAKAAEASSAPPPLPAPRAPYRPRRRATPAPAPAAAAPPAAVMRRPARFRFSGAADLRRAFIASEVLGRPVSLRPPRL
jgi:hypothetical protein